MSTATTAFVRSVIAASTAAGSRFSVRGSTSAKTGVAPSKMKQLADATKETGEVIASSPGPRPAMWQIGRASCRESGSVQVGDGQVGDRTAVHRQILKGKT